MRAWYRPGVVLGPVRNLFVVTTSKVFEHRTRGPISEVVTVPMVSISHFTGDLVGDSPGCGTCRSRRERHGHSQYLVVLNARRLLRPEILPSE